MKTLSLLPVMALVLVGCVEPTEDVGNAAEADESWNSLSSNSLTSNSLTWSSLSANPQIMSALEDPAARNVLTYITGCALPAGVHFDLTIDGVSYGYDGQLGLAPAWGASSGRCDDDCFNAISACVISRLNYLGQRVPISVRGARLYTAPSEITAYPRIDGSYYGDIFASPQRLYACLPPGVTALTRVCGPSLTNCAVDVVGSCTDVCDKQAPDGSFPNCRDAEKKGTKYPGTVTVFLQ